MLYQVESMRTEIGNTARMEEDRPLEDGRKDKWKPDKETGDAIDAPDNRCHMRTGYGHGYCDQKGLEP